MVRGRRPHTSEPGHRVRSRAPPSPRTSRPQGGLHPLQPPLERKGLTNLPPWKKKHHFSLGPRVHGVEQGGPGAGVPQLPVSPRGSSSSGECGQRLRPQGHEVSVGVPPERGTVFLRRPERAGGGGEGVGGWSGLGHVVLIEVRRYESIKNHLLPNSCGGEMREVVREAPRTLPTTSALTPRGGPLRPHTNGAARAAAPWHRLTCLSGAGPSLCPCPDVGRAPGSAPGNSPRADPRCGAGPGAAGCFHETGWETAPEIGVFS